MNTAILAAVMLSMSPLEKAVHQVESSGRTGPGIVGDGGKAIGPLQIWRACWFDAIAHDPTIGGCYEDCNDLEYALKIFRAYTARYAIERRLKRVPTDEDRARIWNGGPNGYKKKSTLKYWKKVQKEIQK
jgi:hypothetical protein